MRNLKRVLSLALAMIMVLGLMVISSSAASAKDFVDADEITEEYREAVDVLGALGVVEGSDTNVLNPQGPLTREGAAKIICYLVLGADAAEQVAKVPVASFDDVETDRWSAGFISYCANTGIIAGNGDGTFKPNDRINGVGFAKMLLVALGYDAEAEGYVNNKDWAINVAIDATEAGLTLDGIALYDKLNREQAFQMALQALQADTVMYYKGTVIGKIGPFPVEASGAGYDGYNDGVVQLVEKLYPELQKVYGGNDVWGRPYAYQWKLDYNPNVIYTEKLAPVYTATVKVDECDIAEAIGLKKSASIESGWIDGYEYPTANYTAITTDANSKIDPQATTSYVGAQGRLTEVYDMGNAGYRIVEINTWLGVVTKVTPATTDKNGHKTDRTITVTVYDESTAGTTSYSFKTNDFVKNDYVLVTVSNPGTKNAKVQSVEAANIVSGGTQTAYKAGTGVNPNTITVNGDKLPNADKFILNLHNTKADITADKNTVWNVIEDSYGNVIGLVKAAINYLVIEQASWSKDENTVADGKVLADVIFADGTRETITIAKVGQAKVNYKSTADTTTAAFTDNVDGNEDYYDHLHSYTVNADGTYTITALDVGTNVTNTKITNEGTYFVNGSAKVRVNDNTMFLVKDIRSGVYKTYVGKNNVPTLTSAEVCYLIAGGYASVVVVTKGDPESSVFDAYVPYTNHSDKTNYVEGKGYEYEVYKIGETEPTTLYYSEATLGDSTYTDSVFTITLKAGKADEIGSVSPRVVALFWSGRTSYDDQNKWGRGTVSSNNGNTLVTDKASYFVDEAAWIVVTRDTKGNLVDVREGDSADAERNSWVAIKYDYDSANEDRYAEYVYIFETVKSEDGTDPNLGTWNAVSSSLKVTNGNNYQVNSTTMEVRVVNPTTSLSGIASDWNTPGTVTITVNGVTSVVPITGNNETISSAIARGAVIEFTNSKSLNVYTIIVK